MSMHYFRTIFDGLRGHYAAEPRWQSNPGLTAASALAAIFVLPAISVFNLVAVLLADLGHARFRLSDNRIWLIAVALASQYLHVWLAKRSGLYDDRGPAKSAKWKTYLLVYVVAAVAVFVLGIVLAVQLI